jgi:hypothetical protein
MEGNADRAVGARLYRILDIDDGSDRRSHEFAVTLDLYVAPGYLDASRFAGKRMRARPRSGQQQQAKNKDISLKCRYFGHFAPFGSAA